MINKLNEIRKEVVKQIEGYKEFPIKNEFDRGYYGAMNFILSKINELDKRFVKDKLNAKESK